ncbi:MAG: PD40 domain-containing protein, partial [Gemmatimonadota bacterium]|nr:PD40 domain-containing protein [Gemmatimonadota bacterium]
GGQVSQLTTGDYNNTLPTWSPDGQWLAYASDREAGHRSIWAMKADGTSQTELTRGTSDDDEPAWSSDGYIYFSSKAAGNYEIWRIKPLLGGTP